MSGAGEGTGLDGEHADVDVGPLGGLADVLELLAHRTASAELHAQRPLVHVRDVVDGAGLLTVEHLLPPQALYDAEFHL